MRHIQQVSQPTYYRLFIVVQFTIGKCNAPHITDQLTLGLGIVVLVDKGYLLMQGNMQIMLLKGMLDQAIEFLTSQGKSGSQLRL